MAPRGPCHVAKYGKLRACMATTDGPALPQVIPCTDFDSYMYTIEMMDFYRRTIAVLG